MRNRFPPMWMLKGKIMSKLIGSLLILAMGATATSSWAADSGFLSDYSLLEATPGNIVSRAYIAPGTVDALASYNSIMVDQPEIHLAADSKYKGAKPDHLKSLADTLRLAMIERLEAGGYQTADQPGPGVIYLRLAVTDLYLKKKKRSILSYTPAGFVVHTTAQAAIRDVWRKIDIVEMNIEAEFVDSNTDKLMAAAVMERGARKDKAKGQKQELVSWEDLDAAMRTFGERVRCNLDNARKVEGDRDDCTQIVVEVATGP